MSDRDKLISWFDDNVKGNSNQENIRFVHSLVGKEVDMFNELNDGLDSNTLSIKRIAELMPIIGAILDKYDLITH